MTEDLSAPPAPVDPGPSPCEAAKADLDMDLGWGLGVVLRAYARMADAVLADVPGGPRGFQILTWSRADHHANQAVMAQQLGIDRTVLTYLLDDLERAGLVERRPDPRDRRGRLIVATDAGRESFRTYQQALEQVEQHLLAPLGDDAARLRGMLRVVATAHADPGAGGSPCSVLADLDR